MEKTLIINGNWVDFFVGKHMDDEMTFSENNMEMGRSSFNSNVVGSGIGQPSKNCIWNGYNYIAISATAKATVYFSKNSLSENSVPHGHSMCSMVKSLGWIVHMNNLGGFINNGTPNWMVYPWRMKILWAKMADLGLPP